MGADRWVYLHCSKSFHTIPHNTYRERWTGVDWVFSCHLDGSEKVEQTPRRVLTNVAMTMVICSERQTQGQGYGKHLVNICWSY